MHCLIQKLSKKVLSAFKYKKYMRKCYELIFIYLLIVLTIYKNSSSVKFGDDGRQIFFEILFEFLKFSPSCKFL